MKEREGGELVAPLPSPHESVPVGYPLGTTGRDYEFSMHSTKAEAAVTKFPHMSKILKLYRNIHGNYKIIINNNRRLNHK